MKYSLLGLILFALTVMLPPVGLALAALFLLIALSRHLNRDGGPAVRYKYDTWARQEPYWNDDFDRKA